MADRKLTVIRAVLIAVTAFFLSFAIFNVAYISYAVHRYPQHNSMAGVAAFYYGLPVGGLVALITFVAVLRVGKKSKV